MFDDRFDVLTYPTVPDRGRDVPDYTATPTAVPVAGVDLQPGASDELIAQRSDATAVRWTAYVPYASIPAGVALTDATIVRVRGRRHQVNGQPLEWGDGSSRLDHLVVALVSWEPPE